MPTDVACYEHNCATYCHSNQKQTQLQFWNMIQNIKIEYKCRKWCKFPFLVGNCYSHTYYFSIFDTFQLWQVQCDDDPISTTYYNKAKKRKLSCCPQVKYLKSWISQLVNYSCCFIFHFLKAPKSTKCWCIFHHFSQKTPNLNKIRCFLDRNFLKFQFLFFSWPNCEL